MTHHNHSPTLTHRNHSKSIIYITVHSFLFFFKRWLIDWLLCWVFVSVLGLSLVAASRGHSSSWCAGLSLSRPLLLRSTGSRRAGSVIVAHGPSCSAACGIFPDQGSNLCPLHWQAGSQPLRHQGSPRFTLNVVYSMGFDKCIMTHIHHYCIIWTSFIALKPFGVSPSHPSLPITPGNHWHFYSLHSFAFSRMSYTWNHTGCSFFRLTSFSDVHLRFFHVFSWLDSSFFLVLNNTPFSECTTVYSPFTCWRTTWLFPSFDNSE